MQDVMSEISDYIINYESLSVEGICCDVTFQMFKSYYIISF